MLVQNILQSKASHDVVTIGRSATVSQAAGMLSEKRIGAVVVSDDGETPLGILSERDIVRELGRSGTGCLSDTVERLMTADLVTCGPGDQADKVLVDMTNGRFRHMPVVDDGKMVGLISIGDVVKARMDELSMEKDALQDMIMGH